MTEQRHVLIVDDDNVSRNLYSRMLEQLSYKVSTADGGNQALRLLQQNSNAFHLLLVDVLMPDMDGIELLRIFKQASSREIPIIMISSSEDPDTIAQCFQSGASDFLQKPINFEMLKRRVEVCETLQKEKENRKILATTLEQQQKELEEIRVKISDEVETPMQVVMKAISELIEGTHSEEQYKGALIAILKSLVSKDLYRPTFTNLMEKNNMMDRNTRLWLQTEYMHDESQQDKRRKMEHLGKVQRMIDELGPSQVRRPSHDQLEPVEIKNTIPHLNAFTFDVFQYPPEELIDNCAFMFKNLGLIDRFNIDPARLMKFLKKIRQQYRPNSYHNFVHAMDVTQFTYAVLSVDKIAEILGPLEKLSILFAAICHDVDHPGLNNNFQINARSQLALLYNDISILENHHCYKAFTTLLDPEYNIVENLSNDDFKEFRSLVVSLILSTDMANHFATVAKFQTRLQTGPLSKENKEDRQLLMSIVLKCADISNASRPFNVAKKWSKLLIDEFLSQGDLEKEKGFTISPMMDRNTLDKVQMQINFIDFIAAPLYKTFASWAQGINPLVNTMQVNRNKWTTYVGKDIDDVDIVSAIASPPSPFEDGIPATEFKNQGKDAVEGDLGGDTPIARVKGFNVLIVEASEHSRVVLNELLTRSGYETMVVSQFSEAITELQENTSPDLVVLDLFNQEIEISEIVSHIHNAAEASKKYIPILGLVDDDTTDIDGFDVILNKPANAKSLMLMIEKCLDIFLNHVPCVDMALALEQSGADEGFILELLYVLIDDGKKQAACMETYVENLNWSELTLQAHSMKGAAAQLACRPLSHAAFILERAAKNRESDVIKPALDKLENRLDQLEKFVNAEYMEVS
jgi:CheY-like chemotaxis protein/HPt (histidine-containing phosphotransfer) domain-containing protein